MQWATRKIIDRSFTGLGVLSVVFLAASLLVILVPIIARGSKAFVFRGTFEHREIMLERFDHGDREALAEELAKVEAARQPLYDMIAAYERELKDGGFMMRRKYRDPFDQLKDSLRRLLGPLPGDSKPVLIREQYGEMRWSRVEVTLHHILNRETWDYSDPTRMGVKVYVPRKDDFPEDSAIYPLFGYLPEHIEPVMAPEWTFYWQFLTDTSLDAHMFGGIWAELLGTFYLTLGAIIFAVPMGVLSAIYLVEFAGDNWYISLLRTFISTLAGVPSIVFGLFGLAFFINTVHVSESKSVLAGSLTLGLLVMPVVIRAAEEGLRSVPITYKEASLSLGAGRLRTILTVILPSALPGILTGVVISMGRAAGETAPIIFTAAVSVGRPLSVLEVFNQPTPALPWNIYNLATEHQAVDQIRHVQYGMVLVLVALVLVLNLAAILLRARISKKLKG